MKRIIFLFVFSLLVGYVVSIDWSIQFDDCNNGKYNYNSYAGVNCNKCGYHKDRLYLGEKIDSWDWFFNTNGKELVFSNKSQAYLYFLNGANGTYDLYKGGKTLIDLLPSNVAINGIKEAIVFIIKNIKVTVPMDIALKDKPAFIEVYSTRFAPTTSSGIVLYPSDSSGRWVRTKGNESNGPNGVKLTTSIQYEDSNVRYVNISNIQTHNECYVGLISWCGDGVTDIEYAESCDNGTDNWDGNGTPTEKNGIVCNTSCEVVQPTCGPAAKEYSVNDSNFIGDFCSFPSQLDGIAPSFPNPGQSVTWTCSLGSQTITCAATRGTSGGGGGGGGDGGGSGGAVCGNGIIESGEQCDDGNNIDGDGCSSTCQLESCAVAGTCDVGTCGPLNGQIINASDTITLAKFKDPGSYHSDFCSNGSILSYSYNPNILNKKFTWYCGITECSAEVNFNRGVIKIYGSYSGATWACSECNGFDTETWENIRKTFLSDYDTEYTRSIMSGDYLPFGWILPDYDTKYVDYCNSSSVGKYNKNSVKVKFKAFDRNGNLVYQTSEYNGFGPGYSLVAFPDSSILGQAYIPANVTKNFSYGENTIKGYITYRQVCESYQVTEVVGVNPDGTPIYGTVTKYRWTDDISSPVEFTTQTFTVTDYYMLQLGTTLTNISNVDLYFNGKSLNNWGILSASTPYGAYDTGDLSKILSDFIQRYKQYAVGNYYLLGDTTTSFKKILTQEVYYKDLAGGNWLIPADAVATVPTTILVENGNVTIDGAVSGSLMLVVKNGKIKIQNSKMNIQTILDGYYITDKGFEVTGPAVTAGNILNQNPSSSKWYADGRLKIRGVLIGPNAENIYKRRRSVLKNWFRAGYGPSWAIENGASLTITSNPNLWLNAPVGSKDLFEMLNVKKGY